MLSHFGHVQLFATPWTAAHQDPLSMEFFRQEYWSELPYPSPRDLPNSEIESGSLTFPALTSGFFTTHATWEAHLQGMRSKEGAFTCIFAGNFLLIRFVLHGIWKRQVELLANLENLEDLILKSAFEFSWETASGALSSLSCIPNNQLARISIHLLKTTIPSHQSHLLLHHRLTPVNSWVLITASSCQGKWSRMGALEVHQGRPQALQTPGFSPAQIVELRRELSSTSPIMALLGSTSPSSHRAKGIILQRNHNVRDNSPPPYPHWDVVQSLSHVWLFVTPWTAAHQASLSFTISQSLIKLHESIVSMMSSNHLILCRPLLLLPSIFPSIRVSSSESVLHIRWPEYWSFSFSISPSNEHSGLISFRMDFPLLFPMPSAPATRTPHCFQNALSTLLPLHLSPPLPRHSPPRHLNVHSLTSFWNVTFSMLLALATLFEVNNYIPYEQALSPTLF